MKSFSIRTLGDGQLEIQFIGTLKELQKMVNQSIANLEAEEDMFNDKDSVELYEPVDVNSLSQKLCMSIQTISDLLDMGLLPDHFTITTEMLIKLQNKIKTRIFLVKPDGTRILVSRIKIVPL